MLKRLNLLVIAVVVLSVFVYGFSATQHPQQMMKKVISGDTVVPTYSPGILVGNTLYLAGKLGFNPQTGELGKDISEQTKFALEAFKPVLAKAGMEMTDIVMVNVYLKNLDDYGAMNEAYVLFFPKDPPARATVSTGLVRNALIEISAIAVKTH